MKQLSFLLILSSLFLLSCFKAEVKDLPIINNQESETTVVSPPAGEDVTSTSEEVPEQTPEDTLKLESQAKTEASLKNF